MENTQISWTNNTFNPWAGCSKVSPGCANCYAETLMDHRYGRVKWGAGQERSRTSDNYWKQPLKWNRQAEKTGIRTKVFCASLSDWLDHEVPIEWLADLILLIDKTPHLDWLLLTKRIEQVSDRLHEVVRHTYDDADTIASYWLDGDPPANVWLGTTVENQKAADDRIPLLLQTPAAVRFLSVEPLLEPIDLLRIKWFPNSEHRVDVLRGGYWEDAPVFWQGFVNHSDMPGTDSGLISWVICGGESGSGARLFDLEWARSLRRQCQEAGVAYFFKQAGSNAIDSAVSPDKLKLRDKKGSNLDEMPTELQVREFPSRSTLANV